MFNGIYSIFNIGRPLESFCIANSFRTKELNQLMAAISKAIYLSAVAGRDNKDLIQSIIRSFLKERGILFISDSKLPSYGSIGFFIIDTGYKEIGYVLEILCL